MAWFWSVRRSKGGGLSCCHGPGFCRYCLERCFLSYRDSFDVGLCSWCMVVLFKISFDFAVLSTLACYLMPSTDLTNYLVATF